MTATPLDAIIRAEIREAGPMPIDRFMTLALGHPAHGYYVTRDPLGRDFTTSPEISQMFGELIGAWLADLWDRMGRPAPVHVAELGPGRGTLMADALRAAAALPGFAAAALVHLVETSPVLTHTQARTLVPVVERFGYTCPVWHTAPGDLPPGPLLLAANEFFDALPVRQFVRLAGRWHERCVVVRDETLAFAASPVPLANPDALPTAVHGAPDGSIAETAPAATAIVQHLAARLAADGGAALIVDYGHVHSAPGDTLQAMQGGDYVPVLAAPGEADITAHVDFEALAAGARAGGAEVHGPVSQAAFLGALGLGPRADRLMRDASPAGRGAIAAARDRLADPRGMGGLFKAMALAQSGLAPAGFGA